MPNEVNLIAAIYSSKEMRKFSFTWNCRLWKSLLLHYSLSSSSSGWGVFHLFFLLINKHVQVSYPIIKKSKFYVLWMELIIAWSMLSLKMYHKIRAADNTWRNTLRKRTQMQRCQVIITHMVVKWTAWVMLFYKCTPKFRKKRSSEGFKFMILTEIK